MKNLLISLLISSPAIAGSVISGGGGAAYDGGSMGGTPPAFVANEGGSSGGVSGHTIAIGTIGGGSGGVIAHTGGSSGTGTPPSVADEGGSVGGGTGLVIPDLGLQKKYVEADLYRRTIARLSTREATAVVIEGLEIQVKPLKGGIVDLQEQSQLFIEN